PLAFGPTSESTYQWTLADLCEQCHRKGGLVVVLDFMEQFHRVGEVLADAILGLIDAIACPRFAFDDPDRLQPWFDLLEASLSIPLVGGSYKSSNAELLGGIRTYAQLGTGAEFTYKNWIEAVRNGRTFVTSGPILLLDIDGHGPGARLQ